MSLITYIVLFLATVHGQITQNDKSHWTVTCNNSHAGAWFIEPSQKEADSYCEYWQKIEAESQYSSSDNTSPGPQVLEPFCETDSSYCDGIFQCVPWGDYTQLCYSHTPQDAISKPKQNWVVTYQASDNSTGMSMPIHVKADNKLEAISKALHVTVWTTDQWQKAKRVMCKAKSVSEEERKGFECESYVESIK